MYGESMDCVMHGLCSGWTVWYMECMVHGRMGCGCTCIVCEVLCDAVGAIF